MKAVSLAAAGCLAILYLNCGLASAQNISAGTVTGIVTDPSSAAIAGATVTLSNPVSNFKQTATTDQAGAFRFTNVPLTVYHLDTQAPGFAHATQQVQVNTTVPMNLNIKLELAGAQTMIEVQASGAIVENVPVAHNDVNANALAELPLSSPASGLSSAITLSTPGVVADSNGFFHPLGDHAQTTYMIDGQPISDQQSKAFSTQMPVNAIQSMELITGMPSAQYGDKTSLVVDAATKSGLGRKPFGEFDTTYGSFGEIGENLSFGWGGSKFGNFIVVDTDRSGRFLDSPEFYPMHDIGNNETFFDRIDYQPGGQDVLHLDLFAARNWFQIPNTYDQPNQDQRQRVLSFNVAPGYQHTFGAKTLITVNPWVRRDFVNYYPSGDPFADLPATLAQNRHLLNYGVRADVSSAIGRHTLKAGTEIKQTRLYEDFSLGITDFTFNPICVNEAGNAAGPASLTNPAGCAGLGLLPNANLQPGLVPYDLTRGGSLFQFRDTGHINEYAVYVQDSYTLGSLTLNGGVRIDQYNGLSEATGVEPRFGASYLIKGSGTVLRASYSRTFETPYNENLLLSSASGTGGLASNVFGAYASVPLKPGTRNQYNTGVQQTLGKYVIVDASYFWKFTDTAYDFDVLFNSPITFPISWRKSKLDGVAGRVSTSNIKGFQAQWTLGHTRARFFGPETGGLIFNSPVDYSVFRIDHDEVYEQTVNARYQKSKDAPWFDFTWRYDSGEVAGNVPDLASVLVLTGAQQAAVGFYCGNQYASIASPITSCSSPYGASRVIIPAAGTFNPDTNPPRIAPRHIFDIAVGSDNLLHTEPFHMTAKVAVYNLANEVALYNFLSTFSGTHFVSPRRLEVSLGFTF
ncbi:MAG TPA: TonB-dependent receptor [Bryobacteraceae bacterium]|nr:TonB-dependent receptor [Bryobacteraceae bacterium]